MNESQKIAIFLNNLAGGAQRVSMNVANGIANRGYDVDLVLVKAQGPYLQDVSPKVNVIDLKARRALASIPTMVRYLRQERPAVVLTALGHINNVALLAQRLAGTQTPIVIAEHNTLSQNITKHSRWRQMTNLGITKRLYPYARDIIAVSSGVADDLAAMTGLPRDRMRVIYNPVITPEMRARAAETPSHPWYGPDQLPVVLGVGSLTRQKDFPTLIRAFERVRAEHPARLLILGEGPERPKLEKLVAELSLNGDVSLPGFVDNPFAYMSHSSVYVLSSLWEGLPAVLCEALYCGPQIVSTDCPSGPKEILADGQYGKLVPMQDVTAMASAIVDRLDSQARSVDEESWLPHEQENVVSQYLAVLLKE